jgi:hypothetical protein
MKSKLWFKFSLNVLVGQLNSHGGPKMALPLPPMIYVMQRFSNLFSMRTLKSKFIPSAYPQIIIFAPFAYPQIKKSSQICKFKSTFF